VSSEKASEKASKKSSKKWDYQGLGTGEFELTTCHAHGFRTPEKLSATF